MSGFLRRFLGRLAGRELPADFPGRLTEDENVLAVGRLADSRYLVATSLGLWLPEGRRIAWHLITKATWENDQLAVIEATETDTVRDAVLLTDQPVQRYRLAVRGQVPEAVHERVTGSVRSSHHRQLPGGGAWFVQRKVAGQDGIVLQVRADPGTNADALRAVAGEVADKLSQLRAT